MYFLIMALVTFLVMVLVLTRVLLLVRFRVKVVMQFQGVRLMIRVRVWAQKCLVGPYLALWHH